ncbi:MAG: hypothetical protein WDO71_28235 [Bacteroidota bacterium]
MFRRILLLSFVAGCLALLLPILAQDNKGIPAIEKAIEAEDYKKADSILKKEVADFIAAGNLDTVVYYIPFRR